MVTVSIPGIHIVTLKFHFTLKEAKGFLLCFFFFFKKWLIPLLGHETEHLDIPESKEEPKGQVKKTESNLKKVPLAKDEILRVLIKNMP